MYSLPVLEARSPKSGSLGQTKVLARLQSLAEAPGRIRFLPLPASRVAAASPWLTIAWLPSSRLASLNLPRLHLHITSSVCVSNPPPDRSCEVTVTAFKAHLHNLPSQDPYLNHICQDFFSIQGEGTFTSSGELSQVLDTWEGGPLTCLPQCPLGSWMAAKKWEKSRKGQGTFSYELKLYANSASSSDVFSPQFGESEERHRSQQVYHVDV